MKHERGGRGDRKGWIVPFLVAGLIWATPGPFAIAYAQRAAVVDASAASLNRSLDALQASLGDLPRDSFDIEAVLLDEGLDPETLYGWVQDRTTLVPYRGLLRGPRGVLMDRVGNSLDRSLLLYELLSAAGDEVRLARGQLDEATARRLLQDAAGRTVSPPASTPASADALAGYAADHGLDGTRLLGDAARQSELSMSLRETLQQRVERQRDVLADELAGVAPSRAGEGARVVEARAVEARAVEATRDHWWVQRQQDGTWIDLDLGAAEAGFALAAAESTVRPDGWAALAGDDPELAHAVTIRVVAECWQNGQLDETVVLDSGPLLAARALDDPITLLHVPIGWPERGALSGAEPGAVRSTVAAVASWVPMLQIGDRTIADLAFDRDCVFEPSDELTIPGSAVSDKLGGLSDLFGGLPGGESAEDAGADEGASAQLSAVWLQYERTSPGSPARTVRRQLFDRIGPAARAEGGDRPAPEGDDWPLALLGRTEILIQAHGLSPAYVEYRLGTALEANRSVLVAIARAVDEGDEDADPGELTGLPPSQLHALAVLRSSGAPSELYLASANVHTFHTRPVAEGDALRLVQSFDIVANDVAVRPFVAVDGWRARLEQGLRDTNAEALLTRLPCDVDTGSARVCEPRPNAADRLAGEPDGWILIDSLDAVDASDLATLPAGLAEALDAGSLALLATSGEPVWWEVDPDTGTALGRDALGWGNAAVDYAIALGLNVFGFAVCTASSSSSLGNASCVAGAFLGWGAGIAALTGAAVAGRVIAAIAAIFAALPVIVEVHSR